MISRGSALGEILIPALADSTLVWAWAAPAIALFVQTIIFWWMHRHVNEDVFMTYEEDFGPTDSDKKSDEIDVDEHDKERRKTRRGGRRGEREGTCCFPGGPEM